MANGELRAVHLSDKSQVSSEVGCDLNFDRVFALLQVRYENPDQETKETDLASIATIRTVTFTLAELHYCLTFLLKS